jgi:hypothetical protein
MEKTGKGPVRGDFVLYGLIGSEYHRVRIIDPVSSPNADEPTVRVTVLDGPYKGKSGNMKTRRFLVQDSIF